MISGGINAWWLSLPKPGNNRDRKFLNSYIMKKSASSPQTNTDSNSTSMNSLSACMNKAVGNGFTVNFKVSREGRLHSESDTEKNYAPEQVHIVNFYRFEGESDPADNSILYLIETSDRVKGMLVDAYGPYAQEQISQFIKQVEDIQKQEKGPK